MAFDDDGGELDDDGGIASASDLREHRPSPGKLIRTSRLPAQPEPADRLAWRLRRLRETIAAARRNLDSLEDAIGARDFDRARTSGEWVSRYLDAVDRQLGDVRQRKDESHGYAADLMALTGERAEIAGRGARLLVCAPQPGPGWLDALDAMLDPERIATFEVERDQRRRVWLAQLDGARAVPFRRPDAGLSVVIEEESLGARSV